LNNVGIRRKSGGEIRRNDAKADGWRNGRRLARVNSPDIQQERAGTRSPWIARHAAEGPRDARAGNLVDYRNKAGVEFPGISNNTLR